MFLSAREATLLVTFTLLLAALGYHELLGHSNWTKRAQVGGILAIILGLTQSWSLIRSQAMQPDVALSFEAAEYLDQHVPPEQRVLFVAKPFTDDDSRYYLEQALRLQGEAGAAAARASLKQMDLSPMDFQRTAIQTHLPERNLSASIDPALAQWIVIWNNTIPNASVRAALPFFQPTQELRAGSLEATVWRRSKSNNSESAIRQ
jgi:hypothetical protein